MLQPYLPKSLAVASLALGVVWSWQAQAGPTQSISPFLSPSFNRTVQGDQHSVDLSAAGRSLGSAQAFFGVDSLSTEAQQYLTSGLQWRSGSPETPLVRLSILRTEGRGAALSRGQTLMRAGNRFDLGGRWYVPDISTEIAQVNTAGDNTAPLGGRAARVGLTEDIGAASYTLGYFGADPQFNALGSSVAAGDRGVELQSHYDVGDDWQFSHDLRLHQATATRAQPGLEQEWVFSHSPELTDIGRPWQLSASLGGAAAADSARGLPITVELAAQTARWRSWRLDSSVGWYDARKSTPLNLPMAGTVWSVSASRGLKIAGLATEFSPSFSLGGSSRDDQRLGSRTGLAVGFSRLSDNINLKLDYLSAGWSRAPGLDNDVQMTLNYRQSVGSIMPGLRTMAHGLHLPWQPRF